MNAIHQLTSSSYGGSPSQARDARDTTVTGAFDGMLDTVATRLDEAAESASRDEHRSDEDTSEDRAQADGNGAEDRDDARPQERKSGDAAALHIPFGLANVAKANIATVAGQQQTNNITGKNEAITGFRFEAPAEMAAPAARLKLDAQIAQERPGVQSRPQTALLSSAIVAEVGDVQNVRTSARAAAERKFNAGESALERLVERKATGQEPAQSQATDTAGNRRSTFAERMADLADRLAARTSSPETAQPGRPFLAAQPALASAQPTGAPIARIGDPATQPLTTDFATETAQATAQTANRAVHGGNPTVQIASRAPQAPAGTPAEQVSVQIQHGVRNDHDRINVRLYPAALGKVEVKLELTPDRAVHAIVTAERPETLDMLARDARILHRALEDAGLQMDSNSLTFQQGNAGDGSAQRFGEQQFGRNPATPGDATSEDSSDLALAESTPEPRRAAHDGMLDVEI